jgi:hypothetical protein
VVKMSSFSKNKNLQKDLLTTSWEIWGFLVREAGLDVKNYDAHIVEEICKRLSIPLPCNNIGGELKKRDVPIEVFIDAFLKSIQPYVRMVSDLYVFFYLYGVKKTNKQMRMLFDFGKGPEDLGFDLKHFRDILEKYVKISRYVTVYGWNHDTLWMLASIFHDFWQYTPKDSNVRLWLLKYEINGEINAPFVIDPPTIDNKEVDLWLKRAWQVWVTFIEECRKYGGSRNSLKEYAYKMKNKSVNTSENERKESYKLIRNALEIPDLELEEWDPWILYVLDSDRWPAVMLRGLFGFAERLIETHQSGEIDRENLIIQSFLQNMQELYSKLPKWGIKQEDLVKEFMEILNLPIWKRRHELYQTWVLTEIDKALETYQRTIHHVDGSLILRFSGTHIGTVETEEGLIHIWSELRSPLNNPVGQGRKGHIQPDYSLTFEPITDPSRTIVVIECKQYRKANPTNFVNAVTDYVRGRPNSRIILVNYGEIPNNILTKIDKNLKQRVLLIGNFRPSARYGSRETKQLETFKDALLRFLPKPLGTTINLMKETLFDLIAVDVSGSMDDDLNDERVLTILRMIAGSSPTAKLLAIDTKVREEWPNAKIGLQQLLQLPRNGSTNLSNALAGYDLSRAVIFTDEQGWQQLSKLDPPPYLVIETREKATLQIRLRRQSN